MGLGHAPFRYAARMGLWLHALRDEIAKVYKMPAKSNPRNLN